MSFSKNNEQSYHDVIVESITDDVKTDFEAHKKSGQDLKEYDVEEVVDAKMEDFDGVYFAYHVDLANYISEKPQVLYNTRSNHDHDHVDTTIIQSIYEDVRSDVQNSDVVKDIQNEVALAVSKDISPSAPKHKGPSL